MMCTALPSLLNHLTHASLQPAEKVEVYSNSKGTWIEDGQVTRVAAEPFEADGWVIPEGSIEVMYGDGMFAKWILADDIDSTVRRPDIQKFLPQFMAQAGLKHKPTKQACADPFGSAARGWMAPVVGKAEARGCRPTMEDEFVHIAKLGHSHSPFIAVYDGHGGRSAVDFVKKDLHTRLRQELDAHPDQVHKAFKAAFQATDKALAESQGYIPTTGCTACCCLITTASTGKPAIYTAHVGDTRAVLSRSKRAVRLTSLSDHKPYDHSEAERIAKAGGVVLNHRVNGMLAVARALGDHYLKAPLAPGDAVSNVPDVAVEVLGDADEFVILACDGVWDVMDDQDAVDLVRAYITEAQAENMSQQQIAEGAAQRCVNEALSRGTTDNVTCSVVLASGPNAAAQPQRISF
eukprot:CAMPEP_0178420716 /NCGR_PEP_ID=MMETSP0689_2-20121128/26275_1 /TAXON_ID=160604 /ORGANISM="Amphidinium massartii, Strain CS-259" /LENGTH=405 /DNA_ID=CAMNT_0020042205 /DNA_START=108 /DNA_END=1325 /DNA_ORIENTATION=+